MDKKKSIAIISFGTTYLDTAEKTIHVVEREVLESFKGYEVVSAYTSNIVRENLLKDNIKVLSPEECFETLIKNGYKDVIVLPTHIIGGEEYSKVVECVEKFSSKFNTIKVCRPFIEKQDVSKIIDTIQKVFLISNDSFLVFMGHGSNTQANEMYHLMNQEFIARGIKNMYISTVEATPELINAIDIVKKYNPKQVILTPFMLVSGDHANNDMAIEWKSSFENANFNTKCILKGIGEYPEFRKIYIDRVKEVLC